MSSDDTWALVDLTEDQQCRQPGSAMEEDDDDYNQDLDDAFTENDHLNQDNQEVWLARASENLRNGRFDAAIFDAARVLKYSPTNVRAFVCTGLAFMKLERYVESSNIFQTAANLVESTSSELPSIMYLWDEAEAFKKQAETGQGYSIETLMKQQHPYKRVAQYSKPVEVRTVANNNKGRGLVATRKITPGELVLVSKAFAFIPPKPCGKSVSDPSEMQEYNRRFFHELVDGVRVRMEESRESQSLIMNLWAGAAMKFLEEKDCKFPVSKMDTFIERLENIIRLNSWGTREPIEANWLPGVYQVPDNCVTRMVGDFCNNGSTLSKIVSLGLWILPSYINHSCEGNVRMTVTGDTIFVHAIRDIPEGEEILKSYVSHFIPYPVRMEVFGYHQFECKCRLCQYERSEPEDIHNLRRNLIDTFHRDLNTQSIISLYQVYEQLENVRKEAPHLNYCLVGLAQWMCFKHAEVLGNARLRKMNMDKYMQKTFDLTFQTEWNEVAVQMAKHLFQGSLSNAAKRLWARRYHDAALIQFGNLEQIDEKNRTEIVTILNEEASVVA